MLLNNMICYLESQIYIFHIIQLLVCMEDVVESFILFMYPSFFGDLWRIIVVWFLCPAERVNLQFVPVRVKEDSIALLSPGGSKEEL